MRTESRVLYAFRAGGDGQAVHVRGPQARSGAFGVPA